MAIKLRIYVSIAITHNSFVGKTWLLGLHWICHSMCVCFVTSDFCSRTTDYQSHTLTTPYNIKEYVLHSTFQPLIYNFWVWHHQLHKECSTGHPCAVEWHRTLLLVVLYSDSLHTSLWLKPAVYQSFSSWIPSKASVELCCCLQPSHCHAST